jgi:hypothetical protein
MSHDPIEMALYDLAVVRLTAHLTAIAVGHSLPSSSAPSTIRSARPSIQVTPSLTFLLPRWPLFASSTFAPALVLTA